MNRVILCGSLGADGELRETQHGHVLSFRMATTETRGSGQERKEITEWHRCSLFGDRAAKLAPYFVKGERLLVEGKLRTRSWDKDGQKHFSTEIMVDNIEFVAPRRQQQQSRQQQLPVEDDGDNFFRS